MAKPDRNKPLKDLLLWLRAERISWGSLSYGDVTIDGAQDIKLIESLPQSKPVAPAKSIIERYGGALIEQPAPTAETFLPVPEDDD